MIKDSNVNYKYDWGTIIGYNYNKLLCKYMKNSKFVIDKLAKLTSCFAKFLACCIATAVIDETNPSMRDAV